MILKQWISTTDDAWHFSTVTKSASEKELSTYYSTIAAFVDDETVKQFTISLYNNGGIKPLKYEKYVRPTEEVENEEVEE